MWAHKILYLAIVIIITTKNGAIFEPMPPSEYMYTTSVEHCDSPWYRNSPYHNWSTVDLDQYTVSTLHDP